MKFALPASLAVGLAAAQNGSVDTWAPGGPDDYRGPCPMLNTLANHGFLPHDGKNLTQEVITTGLGNGLNFDASLTVVMFHAALIANPEPNATYFDLQMLNVHNVLEHDASLSRSDAYFGNNHVFNQTVFDTIKPYFTDELLTPDMLVNAKVFRQVQSRAYNPNYTFTSVTQEFSLGEVIAPTVAFGNITSGVVNRTLLEYFFENERLPSLLGWTKKTDPIFLTNITYLTELFGNSTLLETPLATTTSSTNKRRGAELFRDLHAALSSV